ncbi:class I SAM-dependent methyltransferase [soil metagenome]
MGLYADRVLPRIVNLSCGTADLDTWRERATEGLCGEVVEIGFGSGLNVPHYPDEVEVVHAIEPSVVALRLARERIDASPARIENHGLVAEQLPLADRSCDSALSTFTLCTIADVEAALAEIRRVLRPGGRLHFLEHGHAPDERVATWQRRFEPVQRRVAGGCHLTRRPDELVRAAGFDIDWVDHGYAKGPKPWTWLSVGVATSR